MKNLQQLSHDYLADLEKQQRRTVKTSRNYNQYLRRFLTWSKINKPSDITDKLIEKYQEYLKTIPGRQAGLSRATRNYHLIALRNFNKYLISHGFKTRLKDKITLKKITTKDQPLLSSTQITRLIEAPQKNKNLPIIKLRDTAILNLLIATGMKISELAEAFINDIKISKREIIIDGFNSRTLPIVRQAAQAIKEYLAIRKDSNEHLFISHDRGARLRGQRNQAMSTRSVQRIIEKYAKLSGLPKSVTANTLRHYFATALIKKGADLEELQDALGYTSDQTAKRYS